MQIWRRQLPRESPEEWDRTCEYLPEGLEKEDWPEQLHCGMVCDASVEKKMVTLSNQLVI